MAGEGDGEAEGEQQVEEIPGEHGLTGQNVVIDSDEATEDGGADEEAGRRGGEESDDRA